MLNALGFLLTFFRLVLGSADQTRLVCSLSVSKTSCPVRDIPAHRCTQHPSGSTAPSPELCALRTCARKTPQASAVPPWRADGAAAIIYHSCYSHPAGAGLRLRSAGAALQRGEQSSLMGSEIQASASSSRLLPWIKGEQWTAGQSITQEMSAAYLGRC